MRLLEAIIAANHRALAGGDATGLDPTEYGTALPLVALTCIDPRLNPLLPNVLGILEKQFIWLRNAGNIITSSTSSTMRSLALACAIKGGREIAIIGHTDCLVGRTSMLDLLSRLQSLGVDRARLPENLVDFFGLFGSERQNVLKAVELTRASPLIGPAIPVHGLMLDIQTGRVEWIANGYDAVGQTQTRTAPAAAPDAPPIPALLASAAAQLGNSTVAGTKIGQFIGQMESVATTVERAAERIGTIAGKIGDAVPGLSPTTAQIERRGEEVARVTKEAQLVVEKLREAGSLPRTPPAPPKRTPPPLARPIHSIPPRKPPG